MSKITLDDFSETLLDIKRNFTLDLISNDKTELENTCVEYKKQKIVILFRGELSFAN